MFSFLPNLTRLTPRPTIARAMLALASGAAALAPSMLSADSAQAALVSTGACNNNALSQPFSRWADQNTYELASGGNFEGALSGWTLSGGAARVAGSEPYAVSGSVGAYSLGLPQGAVAQTPFTCVNASYPIVRFFGRNRSATSIVLVQIVYKTPLGTVVLPVGAVTLSSSWAPTLPMVTGSLVGAALTNGTAQAALRFTALTGSSQIDDVYIDPRMTR